MKNEGLTLNAFLNPVNESDSFGLFEPFGLIDPWWFHIDTPIWKLIGTKEQRTFFELPYPSKLPPCTSCNIGQVIRNAKIAYESPWDRDKDVKTAEFQGRTIVTHITTYYAHIYENTFICTKYGWSGGIPKSIARLPYKTETIIRVYINLGHPHREGPPLL